jgi:hypothetical protein
MGAGREAHGGGYMELEVKMKVNEEDDLDLDLDVGVGVEVEDDLHVEEHNHALEDTGLLAQPGSGRP